MDNAYDFKITHPDIFKQLSFGDMLIADHKNPQVDKVIHVLSHYNEIAYTLSGKKNLHHGGKSWSLPRTHLCLSGELLIQQKSMISRDGGNTRIFVSFIIFCNKFFGNAKLIYP